MTYQHGKNAKNAFRLLYLDFSDTVKHGQRYRLLYVLSPLQQPRGERKLEGRQEELGGPQGELGGFQGQL